MTPDAPALRRALVLLCQGSMVVAEGGKPTICRLRGQDKYRILVLVGESWQMRLRRRHCTPVDFLLQ